MKTLVVLGTLFTITACSDGVITTVSTAEMEAPDHAYEIDTWGANSEVYEFTPRSNTNYTCVMYALDNLRAMGLQCFPKPGQT